MKTIFPLLITLLLAPLNIIQAAEAQQAAKSTEAATGKKDAFFTPEKDKAGLKNAGPIDPALPNVLILGDSISIGYTNQVRDRLKLKANVVRPSANCGDTPMGLAGIDAWLGDTHWRVIHFNWGLWDLCYRNPESKTQGHRDKVNGKLSVSLADYEKNLDLLVERLKRTGATLIWASTTTVPQDEAGRIAGDEIKYNAAAERVMKKYGVAIDDLHAVTEIFAPEMFAGKGDVHYQAEGYEKLADQVAQQIESALP